jgi:hypothetical protein
MLCVWSVGFAQIRSDVLPRVIFPVLLSNVLRRLVVFGGKIQGSDNLFRTPIAMRACPDIALNYSY